MSTRGSCIIAAGRYTNYRSTLITNQNNMQKHPTWGDATQTICTILAAGALVVLALMLGNNALIKSANAECLQWEQDAKEYAPHFYLTKWQDDQCKAQGITINAPIK